LIENRMMSDYNNISNPLSNVMDRMISDKY